MKGELLFPKKPDDVEMFSTTEVARRAGCSLPTVRYIAVRLGIQSHIFRTNNARAAYYTPDEMLMICDNYNAKGNDYKSMKTQNTKAVELVEDHPLVKDTRCLKLNWWPETVPSCFEEENTSSNL